MWWSFIFENALSPLHQLLNLSHLLSLLALPTSGFSKNLLTFNPVLVLFFCDKRNSYNRLKGSKMQKRIFPFLLILILLSINQCSKTPSPRVVVMDFIEAVNKADTASLETYLDLERFTQEKVKELPDSIRAEVFSRVKEQLWENFLGSGGTRLRWQNKMIVVNKEKIEGDHALVEVTFVDQKTGITEYTKARLYKKEDRWWIYYIRD